MSNRCHDDHSAVMSHEEWARSGPVYPSMVRYYTYRVMTLLKVGHTSAQCSELNRCQLVLETFKEAEHRRQYGST